MARKKKLNPILVIIGFIIAAHYSGFLGAVLPDPYTTYDGFTGGLRSDLWTFSGNTITCNDAGICSSKYTVGTERIEGEKLVVSTCAMVPSASRDMGLVCGASGSAESKRKFGTENIKIDVDYAWKRTQSGGGSHAGNGNIAIQYGANTISIPFDTNKVNSERTDYTWSGLIEIKRYDDLDLSKYVILIDGIEKVTGVNTNSEPVKISATGKYGYVRANVVGFEPYFSCEIDYNDEVVVRDTFLGGNTINQDSLTYLPIKYCPKDLGVLRISDQGLTDEIGSLTERLAKGESLTIPSDEIWQVDYITKYVDNMTERCGVGQAYDTTENKCVQIAQQMTATETLLYCTKDTDCIIPQKCNDATVSCVSNQCDYNSTVCTPEQIINYVEVIKTVEVTLPEVVIISTGINEFTVQSTSSSHTYTIAGKSFSSSKPSVLCNSPHGQITDQNCYKASFSYNGKNYNVIGGQEVVISPYIKVKYLMTGKGAFVTDSGVEFLSSDWKDSFIFTFSNVYDIELVSVPERIKLGENGQLIARVRNNIHAHNGYLDFITKYLLLDITDNKRYPYTFNEGWNTITYTIKGDKLGGFVGEFAPSLDLYEGFTYVADEKLFFGTYITEDPAVLDCSSAGCTVGECQADGTCLVTETTDCTTRGCTRGTCDTSSGNCEITNYVEVPIKQDCRQLGCVQGTCSQTSGNCVVTQETNCAVNDCPIGECDVFSGNCIVNNYIEVEVPQDCNDLGCPNGGECNPSTGVCETEITCGASNPCPSGADCLSSGLCRIIIEVPQGCDSTTCDGTCNPTTNNCELEIPVDNLCQRDSDCPQDATCLNNGLCKVTVEIPAGCDQSTCYGTCNPSTDNCEIEVPVDKLCTSNLDCEGEQICNVDNGICTLIIEVTECNAETCSGTCNANTGNCEIPQEPKDDDDEDDNTQLYIILGIGLFALMALGGGRRR